MLIYDKSRYMYLKLKLIPNYIISSPFLRTRQTAELMKQEINRYFKKNIDIEINSLICESQLSKKKDFSKDLEETLINDGINIPESFKNLKNRCNKIIKYCKTLNYDTILLVTHGIICNELIKIITPNYKYNNINTNNYFPKFSDIVAFNYNNKKWSVIYSDYNVIFSRIHY